MISTDVLRTEAGHYRLLADQLKTDYGALDDETLADTLEGLSDLPDLIAEIVRSSLEDQTLVAALKTRLSDMQERAGRLKERIDKKRALAGWAMGAAGLARVQQPDFSVALRPGAEKVVVEDEAQIEPAYLVPQPPRVDRAGLLAALKRGETAQGARLTVGEPHIAVRTT